MTDEQIHEDPVERWLREEDELQELSEKLGTRLCRLTVTGTGSPDSDRPKHDTSSPNGEEAGGDE